MGRNILKAALILGLIAAVLSVHKTQISSTLLDGFADDLDVHPFVKVGNKLYYFGQSKVTWYKAFLVCRSMGGFLASIDSQQELAALSDYMVGKYPLDRWWWLSGSDVDGEGDFYWYRTGERIPHDGWSAGQPDNAGGNENCVHLWYVKPKFQMNDWICNQPAYYICETDKPRTVVVSVF